jgi:hypothetical protein
MSDQGYYNKAETGQLKTTVLSQAGSSTARSQNYMSTGPCAL